MMKFKEIQAFICKRYGVNASEGAELAHSLMSDCKYISDCPKVFTPVTLGEYLDRMEKLGENNG